MICLCIFYQFEDLTTLLLMFSQLFSFVSSSSVVPSRRLAFSGSAASGLRLRGPVDCGLCFVSACCLDLLCLLATKLVQKSCRNSNIRHFVSLGSHWLYYFTFLHWPPRRASALRVYASSFRRIRSGLLNCGADRSQCFALFSLPEILHFSNRRPQIKTKKRKV